MSRRKLVRQLVMYKLCVCCKQEKGATEFQKQSSTKDGLKNMCKICVSNTFKEKYNQDPDYRNKIKNKALQWRNENKDKTSKHNKIYSSKYNKKPWARIPQALRKRLSEKTKFKSGIGLKTRELKTYLESLLLPDMNWENYGKVWHIRLIRPMHDFNLNDSGEVSKINHYTNLKPSFSPEFLKSKEICVPT